jgi:site-specific DNA-methyltransferase (adenine-specific)
MPMSHEVEIQDVLSGRVRYTVLCARVESIEPLLPDGCASLMPVDGPYHGQKGDAWDNEHKTAADFLRWKGERYAAWRRILAPNGTIYDFASPAMGARTEVAMREHFEVLCNIRWAKPSGRGDACSKESLRAPFPQSETIIMAEQRGSDSIALGESQYGAKCDELRGFVFEPIRAYLDGERERSGFSRADVDRMLGNQMSGHYFSRVQWALPTLTNYEKLQAALNSGGGEFLRREYDDLRREYDDLRREYDDLRRPYYLTADVPYTDVWTYDTVQTYEGKHLCEKPRALAADMIRASSRPNGLVLVFFAGSGVFAAEALAQGRRVIAVEADDYWAQHTRRACETAVEHGLVDMKRIARTTPRPATTSDQPQLFLSI